MADQINQLDHNKELANYKFELGSLRSKLLELADMIREIQGEINLYALEKEPCHKLHSLFQKLNGKKDFCDGLSNELENLNSSVD